MREVNDLAPTSLLHAYMDLCDNKCCAKDGLIGHGENIKIAASCYGHTTISNEREQGLYPKCGVRYWVWTSGDSQPIRATVKELMQENHQLTHKAT